MEKKHCGETSARAMSRNNLALSAKCWESTWASHSQSEVTTTHIKKNKNTKKINIPDIFLCDGKSWEWEEIWENLPSYKGESSHACTPCRRDRAGMLHVSLLEGEGPLMESSDHLSALITEGPAILQSQILTVCTESIPRENKSTKAGTNSQISCPPNSSPSPLGSLLHTYIFICGQIQNSSVSTLHKTFTSLLGLFSRPTDYYMF